MLSGINITKRSRNNNRGRGIIGFNNNPTINRVNFTQKSSVSTSNTLNTPVQPVQPVQQPIQPTTNTAIPPPPPLNPTKIQVKQPAKQPTPNTGSNVTSSLLNQISLKHVDTSADSEKEETMTEKDALAILENIKKQNASNNKKFKDLIEASKNKKSKTFASIDPHDQRTSSNSSAFASIAKKADVGFDSNELLAKVALRRAKINSKAKVKGGDFDLEDIKYMRFSEIVSQEQVNNLPFNIQSELYKFYDIHVYNVIESFLLSNIEDVYNARFIIYAIDRSIRKLPLYCFITEDFIEETNLSLENLNKSLVEIFILLKTAYKNN